MNGFDKFGAYSSRGGTPVGGRSSTLGPIANRPSVMDPVTDELNSIKSRLGWIDSLILDRAINREAKRAVSDGYLQLIEAKRQELIAKITLGLDEAKKQALVDSLRMSGELDKEIHALSTEFVDTMFDGVHSAALGVAQQEVRRIREIEAAHDAGHITESRYEHLKACAEESATAATEIVRENVAKIIHAHRQKVELCLELFKQRVLSKGF